MVLKQTGHYEGDQRRNDETVIDIGRAGFRERNPQRNSKGGSDKGIKLVFTSSRGTLRANV